MSNRIEITKYPIIHGKEGAAGETITQRIGGVPTQYTHKKIKKSSIIKEVSNLVLSDISKIQSQLIGVPMRAITSKDGLSGSFTQVLTSSEKK